MLRGSTLGGEWSCGAYTMVLGVQKVRNARDRRSSRGRNGRIVASITWLHHQHHCRLLRVSAQVVERSMGGGSAAPCFAEARWEVSGAVLHQNRDA